MCSECRVMKAMGKKKNTTNTNQDIVSYTRKHKYALGTFVTTTVRLGLKLQSHRGTIRIRRFFLCLKRLSGLDHQQLQTGWQEPYKTKGHPLLYSHFSLKKESLRIASEMSITVISSCLNNKFKNNNLLHLLVMSLIRR